jgi:hypothetical protein
VDFSKKLYGKLGWGFVGRIDLCFSVKIKENILRVIRSERREEVPKVEDLNQIFPI